MFLDSSHPLHPNNYFKIEPKLSYPLYMSGMIDERDRFMIAVVGTRKPSLYGIEITKEISRAAVGAGCTVISGLARGIDTEAHRSALLNGGRTIGVLGTGLDKIYPEENIGLAEDIKKNGAVISQFPPETPPLRRNFPLRNYTVALMCSILVVVEAPLKSGSLITAKMALDAGKKVFILPGRINEENMAGNMQFLKEYGKRENLFMLHSVSDLFSNITRQLSISEIIPETLKLELDDFENKVYDALKNKAEGVLFDELSLLTGFGPAELPGVILGLILKNIVEEKLGKTYSLVRGKR